MIVITEDMVMDEVDGIATKEVQDELRKPENVQEWRRVLVKLKSKLDSDLAANKTEFIRARNEGHRTGNRARFADLSYRIGKERSGMVDTCSMLTSRLSESKEILKRKNETVSGMQVDTQKALSLLEIAAMFVPKDMDSWFSKYYDMQNKYTGGDEANRASSTMTICQNDSIGNTKGN
jgi:hypothetical protein